LPKGRFSVICKEKVDIEGSMYLRPLFLMTASFFLILWGFAGYSTQTKVQEIDAQIEQLEDEKRGFEAKALKHEDQAEYLQFNDQALLEQRRHIQLADEYRAKAAAAQLQIDQLKAQREKLLSEMDL
jgi:hypothetical protein